MYNLKDVAKAISNLSNQDNQDYNLISDYIHDLEVENNRLLKEKQEYQNKLSRRNMQIKDLKKMIEELNKSTLYPLGYIGKK
ncbi:hypothetical protein EPO66_03620 [bacterium]|nr:MAG: hypothetical protein EPO66_03620 [bacterium]